MHLTFVKLVSTQTVPSGVENARRPLASILGLGRRSVSRAEGPCKQNHYVCSC